MSNTKRLDMLEMMIAKGSDDPFVHYAHAMELRAVGRREDALAAFSAVAERYVSYVPTYLIGGQLAAELERADDARSFFERGIARASAAGDGKALSELRSALSELD
jgi:predicted RNA polymerase sigma factor